MRRIEPGVELGRWVRQRREALGLTTQELWNRMEMDRGEFNWVSQLENGRRTQLPDFDYINGLSQALRVSVNDVLRGAGVLPIDVEESPQEAAGSHTIHALVDMVDWVREPYYRDATEAFLRGILERQKSSAGRAAGIGHDR